VRNELAYYFGSELIAELDGLNPSVLDGEPLSRVIC
jgi:hypothetical protein